MRIKIITPGDQGGYETLIDMSGDRLPIPRVGEYIFRPYLPGVGIIDSVMHVKCVTYKILDRLSEEEGGKFVPAAEPYVEIAVRYCLEEIERSPSREGG